MRVLFLSPHLDDVAFSCGATVLQRAAQGDDVHLVTLFTRSMPSPTGFALSCQTDKGFPADFDYMALRRREDRRFAEMSGIKNVLHARYPEAPHRGYRSAEALFGGIRGGDPAIDWVSEYVTQLIGRLRPELVFAPSGYGNHVDHLITLRAVVTCASACCHFYHDTPYVIRQPEAEPGFGSNLMPELRLNDIEDSLTRKIQACGVYRSQLDFQFGRLGGLEKALTDYHRGSGNRVRAVERFWVLRQNPSSLKAALSVRLAPRAHSGST